MQVKEYSRGGYLVGINNKLKSTTEVPRDSCRDSGRVCVDIVDNPPISRGQWPVASGHTESGDKYGKSFRVYSARSCSVKSLLCIYIVTIVLF